MEDSERKRRKWQAAACSLQCFARYIVNGSADHLLISFCLLFVFIGELIINTESGGGVGLRVGGAHRMGHLLLLVLFSTFLLHAK